MCASVSGTRRITTADVEQVFKNHGAYGFEAGVWYVLYSPVPLPANKQRRCLDAIFGLSFAELQYLLGDDGLFAFCEERYIERLCFWKGLNELLSMHLKWIERFLLV